ncbi:5-bromo-4-chloroindolyl phosphate hydrolysis protein [Trichococcus palustris]|uniref:5-bromo-4-chloroindolyl phosphate hydrolysis protein n=1 Tax=Trichococcus palustris TaxID=140314 RepID=A0A143YRC2_9LACT|nr:5-bromo-4-chloroindolyl phosphate hydrolysis family protein [Trichococcus palustris]CZQ94843.1 5-bromo-4-chloroindolyl phosphate hydrolysis protein [Trichococcus palustris]SFK92139.1 5-bromo-4-chloroindolyl phosphate hydrolysis protein [Trichococcus palustris]
MWNNIKDIMKYTFSSLACLIGLAVFYFVFGFDFWTSIGLTVVMGAILFYLQSARGFSFPKKSKSKPTAIAKVSPTKEAFYLSKGLTKDQIAYFRNTLFQAKSNIQDIEYNFDQVSKLKAISIRNDTMDILKDFFKNIVEQPQRLHEVDKFLYTHLPNLKELTEKYIDIDGHVSKTKGTYAALEESARTIDEMCQLIAEDYVTFMSNDIKDLDIEMELAKQVLKRDNSSKDNENALDEEL